jgi:hypothetical protein
MSLIFAIKDLAPISNRLFFITKCIFSTNISLNFGMQSDSSNQSFEQARQQYETEVKEVDVVPVNQVVEDEVKVDTTSNDYM